MKFVLFLAVFMWGPMAWAQIQGEETDVTIMKITEVRSLTLAQATTSSTAVMPVAPTEPAAASVPPAPAQPTAAQPIQAQPIQAQPIQAQPVLAPRPSYSARPVRRGATSSLSDLVFFPSRGQVYAVAHGVGMFRKADLPTGDESQFNINHNHFMAGSKVLFALSDYVALGAGLSFSHMKMKIPFMGAIEPDDENEEDSNDDDDNSQQQNSVASVFVNQTSKQLNPSLVLSLNPLGQRPLPVDLRLDFSFTPEWIKYQPKPSVSASFGDQQVGQSIQGSTPDKVSDLGVQMKVGFKAHPVVQLAVGAGYSKGWNISKNKSAQPRQRNDESDDEDDQEEADQSSVFGRLMGGDNQSDSNLDASFEAQFSIQDMAFIHTGLFYNMQLDAETQSTNTDAEEKKHYRKDLHARLGVRAIVHPQIAVHVGGGYQLWHSKPEGDESKWKGWQMAAGLQAVF